MRVHTSVHPNGLDPFQAAKAWMLRTKLKQVWKETADEVVASTAPMAEWSVGAVASWLEGLDMAGPAAMLSAQGLNGADLLSFESAFANAHDLGTTPFVAKKVLMLRGQHRD